jgi:hypothetical protein
MRIGISGAALFFALAMTASAGKPENKGNNLPHGDKVVYGLEVIAFDNCPAGDFLDSSRRMIAVQADFNFGVCSDDKTQGCDEDDDCVDGVCITDFGVCSNDTSEGCQNDFQCDPDAQCDAGLCNDGVTECRFDSDCLTAFCSAGVLPKDDPSLNIVRTNQIILQNAGTNGDFAVLDGNACNGDGDGATFAMPTVPSDGCEAGVCVGGADDGEACESDSECGPSTNFWVYWRLVGKPGSSVGVTLCGEEIGVCDTAAQECIAGLDVGAFCDSDADCGNGILCSANHAIALRTSGKGSKPQYTNVTEELLTICITNTGEPDAECSNRNGDQISIFDADFAEFFWVWNTKGRPHAQLRFVEQSDAL